jgi:Na+/proline symporter
MGFLDYLVLFLYAAGMLFIGSLLSRRNKTSTDMFAVSKQSPWWLSGLSAFMSAFSAGTFVVWGGIAYQQGLVAVSICMCSGVSSFLVGRWLAGKWAGLGITSVGEYLNLRFGPAVVQFYTWVGMLFKIVAMGVALYAFSTLVCTIVTLPMGHILADDTGHLAKSYATVLSGLLMLVYAVSGGLWAVLIIDAIQFVVLTVTVLFVIPLCFGQVGGVSGFLAAVPKGFLSPVSAQFSYLFLLGWIIVHTFKLGGEWVFIQRFLAVRSPADARKSSYLFGTLYLVSPLLWMLPPMTYRLINPAANPEQAYFLACALVLPPGMIGLLLAAMFSSAASYIDGEVNVYAGAVTNDFYQLMLRPQASEQELVLVGRISSFAIGGIIIGLALAVPYLGGAQKVILTLTSLLAVALVLPVLGGLFLRGIGQSAVWWSSAASFAVALVVKLGLPAAATGPLRWYAAHAQVLEVYLGIAVPLLVVLLLHALARREHPGYGRVQALKYAQQEGRATDAGSAIAAFPARMLAYSIAALGALLLLLAVQAGSRAPLVVTFGLVLVMTGSTLWWRLRRPQPVVTLVNN